MRDFIILTFKLLPFVVNLISILAGILLFFWLGYQRRKFEEIHKKEKEEKDSNSNKEVSENNLNEKFKGEE